MVSDVKEAIGDRALRVLSDIELSNCLALLAALEAHDSYTAHHAHTVVELATTVAEVMELDENMTAEISLVALLHDVGKLALSDRVLNKRGALSPRQVGQVREHPVVGARVVEQLDELARLAPMVRAAHERWDGGGYPDGLAGENIPIASRIVFVCDAYDAMTSDRPYRAAMSHDVAVDELRRCSGSQFCARCVDALLEVLERGR